MRNRLLTTVACLVLYAAHPAQAQYAVFDSASYGQLITEARQGAQQLQYLEQQLDAATSSLRQIENINSVGQTALNQLTNFYNSMTGVRDLTSFAGIMQSIAAKTPLSDLANIESMLRGSPGSGFTGTLASQAAAIFNENTYYSPNGTDFTANRITSQGSSIAATMAAAKALMDAQGDRLTGYDQLTTLASQSDTTKAAIDAGNAIAIENGRGLSQEVQAQAAQTMAQSQALLGQLQEEQARRKSAEWLLSNTSALSASGGTSGTPPATSTDTGALMSSNDTVQTFGAVQ